MARWLAAEPVGAVGVAVLTPQLVDARISAWRRAGASVALVWARWAVLHSCLSWATRQRLLRSNPLATMKAPPRPLPRKHLRMDEIAVLLRAADAKWLPRWSGSHRPRPADRMATAVRRRAEPTPDPLGCGHRRPSRHAERTVPRLRGAIASQCAILSFEPSGRS
jgi:hypothetical protein